jgi:DNA (cytosine-5)-methyltransferase 1
MKQHRFQYKWTLAEANFTKDKGKVFSCFSCGGGSTMGYKLAGFDVIGCNEIDPKMMKCYKINHDPKYAFLEPIQTFKDRLDLPDELYQLDILDGSPPCSSFSMAGNRSDDWGKEKIFREGQAEQVLDTLFFDFIDLAKKLQPKVVIAENVEGLLFGEARSYVRKIYTEFDKAGYYCQHWLLDASEMGVPQVRRRVFFICLRKDLADPFLYQADMFTMLPKIKMEFNEPGILFGEYRDEIGINDEETERGKLMEFRIKTDKCCSDINERVYGKFSGFNAMIRHDDEICGTITSSETDRRYFDGKRLTANDLKITGTFPLDYNFNGFYEKYIIGMSVPPVMTAQIATEVYNQWLSKINEPKPILYESNIPL